MQQKKTQFDDELPQKEEPQKFSTKPSYNNLVFENEKDFSKQAREQFLQNQSNETNVSKIIKFILKIAFNNKYYSYLFSILSQSNSKDTIRISNQKSAQNILEISQLLLEDIIKLKIVPQIHEVLKIFQLYKITYFQDLEKYLDPILKILFSMLEDIPQLYQQNGNYFTLKLVIMAIQNLISQLKEKNFPYASSLFLKESSIIVQFTSDSKYLQETGNIHFLRLLSSLIRSLNFCLIEIQQNQEKFNTDQNLRQVELIFQKCFKYMFLGNNVYHVQIFGKKLTNFYTDEWKSDGIFSSASEYSENDDFTVFNNKKKVDVEVKIRNYTCLLIQTVIRLYPTILQSQWQLLIKSNQFGKEFIKILTNQQQMAYFSSNQDLYKKNFTHILSNYMEPSLIASLVFEDNNKIKMNLLNTILILIDNLPIKQWLQGIDADKIDKFVSNNSSKSYQMFVALKNLYLSLLFLLQKETDLGIFNQILRVFQSMIQNTSLFEKLPCDIGVLNFCDKVFVKILQNVSQNFERQDDMSLLYDTFNCVNSFLLLKINKPDEFCKQFLYFQGDLKDQMVENKNNILIFMINILDTYKKQGLFESIELFEGKEAVKNILILEALSFFIKLQKQFSDTFLQNNLSIWYFFQDLFYVFNQKLKPSDKKLQFIYKLIEELTHVQSYNTNIMTDEDDNNPQPQQSINEQFQNILYKDFIHKELALMLQNPNLEIIQSSLNISCNISNELWASKFTSAKDVLISTLMKFSQSNTVASKLIYYRCLGLIPFFDNFLKNEGHIMFVEKLIEGINLNKTNQYIQIKISWAIANWCSKFRKFSQEIQRQLLDNIIQFSSSGKDKIISNGMRGIGHFLQNNKIENYIDQKLKQVFQKNLNHKSAKVCWNTCVALQHILKSNQDKLIENFFETDEIMQSFFKILQERQNFKTQIHCIQTLILLDNKYIKKFLEKIQQLSMDLLQEIGQPYSQLDFKYLDDLQESALILYLKATVDFDLDNQIEYAYFCKIVEKNSLNLLEQISKFLLNLWRKTRIYVVSSEIETEKKISEKGHINSEKVKGEIFNLGKKFGVVEDEEQVKVDNQHKNVQFQFKNIKENLTAQIRQKLYYLKTFSQYACRIVDSNDEIRISFALYDVFKEYAELDIDSDTLQITI